MRNMGREFARVLCTLASVMLASCASTPTPPAAPLPPKDAKVAEAVFETGYRAISERFVEPLTPETIAITGLRGLARLDPEIAVGRVGDQVTLAVAGQSAGNWPTPRARDVSGWARLSLEIWEQARARSPLLRNASNADVFRSVFTTALADQDPFVYYASAHDARLGRERRDGERGIGAGVRIVDDEPTVTEISGRGAAERAGLRVGDVLVSIDGKPLAGLDETAVMARLRGMGSGWANLGILRSDEPDVISLAVARGRVPPDTLHYRLNNDILQFTVSRFTAGTADGIESVITTMMADRPQRVRGIVLDLRGNPGGLLQQAVRTAELFLSDGFILATLGRHPDSLQVYQADSYGQAVRLPIVILIDRNTASAAELLAAALRDRGRAVLVGSTTTGKGWVQTVVPLPDGAELRFTWAHAVLPAGETIAASGLKPTFCTSSLYVADQELIDNIIRARLSSRSEVSARASSCTAETRNESVDMVIAHQLIDNRTLYIASLSGDTVLAAIPSVQQQ